MTQQEALARYQKIHREWQAAQREIAEGDAKGMVTYPLSDVHRRCTRLMHEDAKAWAQYRKLGGQ